MIHAVTSKNRHLYRVQLWEMFVERRKAFYDKCGWKDLMIFEGGEVDDLDDDRAVYLLALDEEERVEAGMRVRPTDDRCILADKYPQLIGPGAPVLKGPEAWETTRIFTTERGRERRSEARRRSHEVGVAGNEYIFDQGGRRSVGMIDLHLFPWVSDACGGVMKIIGPPMPYAYGVMVGTSMEIDAAMLEANRDSIGEPVDVRLVYEVDEDDISAFGSLAGVQRAVDQARHFEIGHTTPDRDSVEAVARATALYARHDAVFASGRRGARAARSEQRTFQRPTLNS
jgi:acyl-homoserine lactone synthase